MSESHTLSGMITYTGTKKGTRADLEQEVENMTLDICLYAAGKYPGFRFESRPVAAYQKLSERLK